MWFLAGFASGVFCVLGTLVLIGCFVMAAWRDGLIKSLNRGGGL